MRNNTATAPHFGVRRFVKLALVSIVCFGIVSTTKANDTSADKSQRTHLRQIVDAVEVPRDVALVRLNELRANLPESASYELRYELLQTLRETQVDAGRFPEAQRTNEQLRGLAKKAADDNALADASCTMPSC